MLVTGSTVAGGSRCCESCVLRVGDPDGVVLWYLGRTIKFRSGLSSILLSGLIFSAIGAGLESKS